MPFKNRIRLPIKITRPQFPEERSEYRKANGEVKTLSVVVRKVYEGQTDYLPEKWHERLKMALSHDEINIEGDKYLGGIAQEGDYNIDWQTFLDYPTAMATFKAQVTPFSATNNNCISCAEATQLNLVDDTIPNLYDLLEEEGEYEINVATNDEICCYPAVFSITSYNTTFLLSAVIDQSGNLSIVMRNNLQSANDILLVTYRVTCPSGAYDEAGVYGSVNGSVMGACVAPTDLEVTELTTTSATISWTAAVPDPDQGYLWELYEGVTLIDSGQTDGLSVDLSGLDPATEYTLLVKSDCGGGSLSNLNPVISFTTLEESEACGRYEVTFDDGSGLRGNSTEVTYLNCDSEYATTTVFNLSSRFICALQASPGLPIYIEGASTIDYIEPC